MKRAVKNKTKEPAKTSIKEKAEVGRKLKKRHSKVDFPISNLYRRW